MARADQTRNLRILIVDDNPKIHEDFQKILGGQDQISRELDRMESELFGTKIPSGQNLNFSLDSAYQGQEALEKVKMTVKTSRPYAVAFVDIRMPPGWDGIETITRLWEIDPELQVVICTAYSDYSWQDMVDHFGFTDKLIFLKKPFDIIEVRQLACTLTNKWTLARQVQNQLTGRGLPAGEAESLKRLLAAYENLRQTVEDNADNTGLREALTQLDKVKKEAGPKRVLQDLLS